MINFKSASLRQGTRLLFEEASFTIHRGDKVGITGANGSGKSSLFRMILGDLSPESGDLTLPPGLVIAHVAQETPAVDRSALDYVLDGDHELRELQRELAAQEQRQGTGENLAHLHTRLEAIGGYQAPARAARLLHGLGFAAGDELRPVTAFSGGWRMRLNIAQALMCRSDLLLLDEPTNHLDLDAVIWLQEWLAGYPGTLLLISHDRDFLDDLVDHVLNIEHQTLTLQTGNYSDFETRRAEALAQQTAAFERQQRDIRRIQGFVDRFRAKATKARQVQSRLKALERMTLIAMAQADSTRDFSFPPPEKAPSPLLRLDDAAAGYGGRPVFTGGRLSINPGDRIGLLGPNGAGKSTLVKVLAGELPLLAGDRIAAQDLRVGYFAQHQLEQLRPEESPLWHLQRLDPRASEKDLRGFLGGFGFQGEQALASVAPFSGGEKSRLALALLVYRRPNLLLLDEPTNHLDLAARDALSLALQDFGGALVVVSHDRYLLRSVADDLWLVADGTVSPFAGDLDDYRRWLGERRNRREASDGSVRNESRRDRRRSDADRRRLLRPLRQAVEAAESAMAKLQAEKQRLAAALADPAAYAAESRAELQRLLLAQAACEKALVEAEGTWLQAAETLEIAEADLESASLTAESSACL